MVNDWMAGRPAIPFCAESLPDLPTRRFTLRLSNLYGFCARARARARAQLPIIRHTFSRQNAKRSLCPGLFSGLSPGRRAAAFCAAAQYGSVVQDGGVPGWCTREV